MSSLTTTTINTGNGTTSLTVSTGNTEGPALVVSSGAEVWIRGNTTANVFIANTTAINMNAAVTMTNTAAVGGAMTVNGSITANGSLSVNGAANVAGALTVTGLANVGGTLNVTGAATVNGIVTINANGTVNRLTSNTIVTVNGSVSTNTFTLGASSLAANGYGRLPNGLLMQWGTQSASVNNATQATATFPATFSSVYSVQVTIRDSSTTATALAPVINTISTTTFTWKSTLGAAAATANIQYLAIGT